MAGNVKRFYELTAKLLSGEVLSFSALRGKVVLIENVASLWGTTTRDYTQMNELHSRYAAKGLVILGVPCNQFGHQVRRDKDLKHFSFLVYVGTVKLRQLNWSLN